MTSRNNPTSMPPCLRSATDSNACRNYRREVWSALSAMAVAEMVGVEKKGGRRKGSLGPSAIFVEEGRARDCFVEYSWEDRSLIRSSRRRVYPATDLDWYTRKCHSDLADRRGDGDASFHHEQSALMAAVAHWTRILVEGNKVGYRPCSSYVNGSCWAEACY